VDRGRDARIAQEARVSIALPHVEDLERDCAAQPSLDGLVDDARGTVADASHDLEVAEQDTAEVVVAQEPSPRYVVLRSESTCRGGPRRARHASARAVVLAHAVLVVVA